MLSRFTFEALCTLGQRFGGIRPRRIYDWLARRAFPEPSHRWATDRYGLELYLSPHSHIDRCILAFGEYESGIHRLLEQVIKPGMICLDVGANIGHIALRMAQLGAVVHAFEPAPPVYQILELNSQRNGFLNLFIHPLALSDRDGEALIAYARPEVENQGMGSIVNMKNLVVSEVTSVPAMRLDTFTQKHSLARIDFIKLDVQGAEPLFWLGSEKTISKHKPIVVTEISGEDLNAGGRTVSDFINLIEASGYRVEPLGARAIGDSNHNTANAICIPLDCST